MSVTHFFALFTLLMAPAAATASEFVVVGTGDIMLSATAEKTMAAKGFDWAFDGTRGLLAGAHAAIGNLEGPITTGGTQHKNKTFTFRQKPALAPALKKAGFDFLSLANNHTLDYGAQGLFDTIEHLTAAGLAFAGAGKDLAAARAPAIREFDGVRVGVLAYSLTYPEDFWAAPGRPGTVFGHEDGLRADVRALRPKVDLLVVAVHWGAELMAEPKPYQKRLGHAAIDEGADIVFGHHPHILQGIETYAHGVIFYSLGNFAFGSGSRKTRTSAIGRVVYDRAGAASGAAGVTLTPVRVEAVPLNVFFQDVEYNPRVVTGAGAAAIAKELAGKSKAWGAAVTVKQDIIQVTPVPAPRVPAVKAP